MALGTLQDRQLKNHTESPSRNDGTASEVFDSSENLAVIISEHAHITYIGYAKAGSLTSSPVWKIKKLDESSGLVITWADGNTEFDNIFDDIETLTYL